jgi:hypothetical protein
MSMADIHLAVNEEFGLNLQVYNPPHDYIYYVTRGDQAAIFFERDGVPDGVALFDWDANSFKPCTLELFTQKMMGWFGEAHA